MQEEHTHTHTHTQETTGKMKLRSLQLLLVGDVFNHEMCCRFQDVTEENKTSLKITKAVLTDGGEYQALLENKFGKTTFTVKVQVRAGSVVIRQPTFEDFSHSTLLLTERQ